MNEEGKRESSKPPNEIIAFSYALLLGFLGFCLVAIFTPRNYRTRVGLLSLIIFFLSLFLYGGLTEGEEQ